MPAYTITVNKQQKTVSADADTPLLWILRDELGLTGTKFGCGKGYCGACTVHLDDKAIRACTVPVSSVTKGKITTVEGLCTDQLHPVQKAWIELDLPQCGYCQPGQIMAAAALLSKNPNPTGSDINTAMSGNLCRCGTYMRIRQAIKLAAHKIRS